MRPVFSTASAAARSASAYFLTSVTRGYTFPPPTEATSAAAFPSPSAFTSHMTTFAPAATSVLAVQSDIPLAAPVNTAVFPA